ncbi:MAG: anthranilate phosphoribosyltransferase [Pseudanabaenaceae cyanobacterium]
MSPSRRKLIWLNHSAETTMSHWTNLLKQLIAKENLSNQQATHLMTSWLHGDITPEVSAGILVALQSKGITADELAGMAQVLQDQSEGQKFSGNVPQPLLDTCGTGGDGTNTFNISTAVAFVTAAAGVAVAKHGNRAVSSRSGSADVLEAIGINLTAPTAKIYGALEAVGITFLFAPNWHPAMKAVAPIRKALGIRTIFNLIGPLVNPLQPTAQVLGVYDHSLSRVMAEALQKLGKTKAVVLHSREGMDEAGLGNATDLTYLNQGELQELAIFPQDLGLTAAPLAALHGGDVTENASLLRQILQGKGTLAQTECVALNAGFALCIADRVTSWQEGVDLAKTVIQSGAPWDKAEALMKFLSHD